MSLLNTFLIFKMCLEYAVFSTLLNDLTKETFHQLHILNGVNDNLRMSCKKCFDFIDHHKLVSNSLQVVLTAFILKSHKQAISHIVEARCDRNGFTFDFIPPVPMHLKWQHCFSYILKYVSLMCSMWSVL